MSLDFPISGARLRSLVTGAYLVPGTPALFRIEGSGALTCLQGLLTNDLEAPGKDAMVYGALLTPKGMIVFDTWVIRQEDSFLLVADGSARSAALELFRRALPPRLAKVTDLSETHQAAWLLGGAAPEKLARAIGAPVPGHGKVLPGGREGSWIIAGGTAAAPFSSLVITPAGEGDGLAAEFRKAGGECGTDSDLAALRVRAGWPTLGREIDEKTLPQEVRFEELGGVSYTKGCYTGQETVARIHFRGHVNRTLRGLRVDGAEPFADRAITKDGKEVGTVRSALLFDHSMSALASIRREVENGATVTVDSRTATVVGLPFNT